MAALESVRGWLGLGDGVRPKAAQEHSRFNYSPELIPGLKGDHAELLKQYGEIERMAVSRTYAAIPAALADFKEKLDVHLLNENLHFYCYVEERARDQHQRELIKRFRSEMNAIARGALNFIKTYRQAGVHPANSQTFLTELRQVGALLVKRIEAEEKQLYALYQP